MPTGILFSIIVLCYTWSRTGVDRLKKVFSFNSQTEMYIYFFLQMTLMLLIVNFYKWGFMFFAIALNLQFSKSSRTLIKCYCQKWDSNPRPQSGLRPERSALDHSAILTTPKIKKIQIYLTLFELLKQFDVLQL